MYSAEDIAAIAGPKATHVTADDARRVLDTPSGTRPRVYGIRDDGTEILAIRSVADLDRHAPDHIWISGATIADIVGRS